jgi:hypothetical protein
MLYKAKNYLRSRPCGLSAMSNKPMYQVMNEHFVYTLRVKLVRLRLCYYRFFTENSLKSR